MYQLIKQDGKAKRGRLTTVHGVIETPVFMNVGTAAAIKGAVSTMDLQEIGTQVELSNTYHLHVRPGDEIVKKMGGLHKFMVWDKPILTDSGGFQVFSLAGLRKIKEEGVRFNSHIDGRKIFMGPEESMQIQSNLASTIAMAFDECPPSTASREYIQNSVERTYRWLVRCKNEMARLNGLPDTINPHQMLFGINQGGIYEDIRIENAKEIAKLDLDGYAVGGLLIGTKIGEEKDVTVTFPEDYHEKSLAGQEAVFKCKVNAISVKELPEADDEFASEVSEFETLAEYKEDIKKKLTEKKEKAARAKKEAQAIEKAVENATMEIPDAMIDTQVQSMMEDFARRMQSQGLSLEQYFQFTGMDVKKMHDQMKPEALKRIQNSLVLEAVAKAENIEISDEKVDVAKMAEAYKMEVEKLKDLIGESEKDQMKKDLAVQAAADLIADAAKEA